MPETDQPTRYLKDITEGTSIPCGSLTLTEEEIISFAEQFDPLDIHTDPEVAAKSRYNGIVASGYHTLLLSVRLLVEEVRSKRAVIAGLGIDTVRWHEPVRPGDTITVETTITETRPSESDPASGIIHEEISVTNQSGIEVLSLENFELIERQEPE